MRDELNEAQKLYPAILGEADNRQIIASYDTSDIIDAEVQYKMENFSEIADEYNTTPIGKVKTDKGWETIDQTWGELFASVDENDDRFYAVIKERGLDDDLRTVLIDTISSDSDLFQIAWDDAVNNITEWMNSNTIFYAEGRNMGWRNQSGKKTFKASNGSALLDAILPKTDVSFVAHAVDNGAMEMTVYHHDSPTGEFYTIRPIPDLEIVVPEMMGETQTEFTIESYQGFEYQAFFEVDTIDNDGETINEYVKVAIDLESMDYEITEGGDDDLMADSRIQADLAKFDEVMKQLGITKYTPKG